MFAVLATSTMFSPQARAATAHVDSDDPSFVETFYDAAAGEQNELEATQNAQGVRFVDTGAVITAGAGCAQVDAHEVFCSVTEVGWDNLSVELGDQNDTGTFSIENFTHVFGGPGSDHLTSGGTTNTGLLGEGGADVLQGAWLTGGSGDDTLTATATADGPSLDGGGGDDTLTGAESQDSFRPGPGDDTVDGGPGGGSGGDWVFSTLRTDRCT